MEKFEKICLLLCESGRQKKKVSFVWTCIKAGAWPWRMNRLMMDNFGMEGKELARSLICNGWSGIYGEGV